MSQAVEKNLIPGTAFDISSFTEKSLQITPGAAGDYTVQVTNDGTTFVTVVANVTTNVLIRGGRAATDLPLAVKQIKIIENVAGASPVFAFLGLDTA